jgi:hypothetical protein
MCYGESADNFLLSLVFGNDYQMKSDSEGNQEEIESE